MSEAATHLRRMFTTAAEQMSAEDYAYRPTAEVRSFGELIGHVIDTNFWFCAVAAGEQPPSGSIEKTVAERGELQKILAQSFDACERVYKLMSNPEDRSRVVDLMGEQRTAQSALDFRLYHGMLHWGNAITYMRLRGRVPPSS